jgi:hypothetical protein
MAWAELNRVLTLYHAQVVTGPAVTGYTLTGATPTSATLNLGSINVTAVAITVAKLITDLQSKNLIKVQQ